MQSAPINTSGKDLILIVDRDNLVGGSLAERLSSRNTIVFVSHEKVSLEEAVIVVAFGKTMPQIPDGVYKKIMYVWTKESADLLQPLVQKAESQDARLLCVVKREHTKEVERSLEALSSNCTILILGDYFGRGIDSPLQNFLYTTKATKKITLSHMGLHLWYPVLQSDLLEKIDDILFSDEKKDNLLFLGPKHPLTALRLAHSLQKIDPTITIDFSKEKEEGSHVVIDREEKSYALFDEYDSIKKLQDTYEKIVVSRQKDVRVSEESVFTRMPESKRNFPWTLYIGYVVCIFLFLPFLIGLATGAIGGFLLSSSATDMQKGDMTHVAQKITAARENFALAKEALSISRMELSLVGKENLVTYLQKKVILGYQFSQIAEDGIGFYQHMSAVLNGKTDSPKDETSKAVGIAKHMLFLMQEVSLQDIPKQYQSSFLALQKLLGVSSNVIDEVPLVLGVGQDKTYLVLFQNNMELRPGGGFIGSYGLISLHNGQIKDFSIHDVYDADGQLQGHVEPPFAIRRYIPIVHLFLRDSNFDVDFTKNAQTAAFLLSQETGVTADGVIGIDLETLRSALSAMGSVYVPSYNETVTDKNFFTLIEKHVEKNTFPGSVQKKEFLSTFFAAFMDKLKKNTSISGQVALEHVGELIEGKHILAAFSDPSIQLPFSLADLSGSLPETPASASAQTNDFLGISEANLGVNKVNAFVTRKVDHHISIDNKGSVQESVVLSLSNSSDGTWPGGEYRNYIRFIVPNGASIKSIALNNVEQKIVDAVTSPRIYEGKGFIPPKGLEVAKDIESNKTLFGFLVTVPQQSTLTITLTYALSGTLDFTKLEQLYNVFIWKQPGITEYPYRLTISLPDTLGFLKSNTSFSRNGQDIQHEESVNKDTDISVQLTVQ